MKSLESADRSSILSQLQSLVIGSKGSLIDKYEWAIILCSKAFQLPPTCFFKYRHLAKSRMFRQMRGEMKPNKGKTRYNFAIRFVMFYSKTY